MLLGVEAPTGAMQEFRGSPSQPPRKRQPGLVLLYADTFRELPAAFLLKQERHVVGRDLGSRNGVIVNGRKVQSSELEPLDEVRIGDAIFKFVEEGAEELA